MKRLFQRLRNRRMPNPIKVGITQLDKGLYFSLRRQGEASPLHFPLRLSIAELRSRPSTIAQLELLEELWDSGYLQEESQSYFLHYDYLYELEPEERGLLGLPETPVSLDLKLEHEGIIGTPRFRFILEKGYQDWKHLERTAKQNGPLITLPNGKLILMDEAQYKFECKLINMPDPKDKENIFAFIAEVRKHARELNIPMNSYLERQEYLFVDQIYVDLEYKDQTLHVKPKYVSDAPINEDVLDEMARQGSSYATVPNREKVFVKREIVDQAKQINRVGSITGADIPKFVQNPESFLPEIELDLAKFSERVKELGIKVYRAQPYVYAKETDRGWFDLQTGFSVVNEEGEVTRELGTDEIKELVQKARDAGEEFIEWNGQWLKIPEHADKFLAASDQLEAEIGQSKQVDISRLPYVLEIYENINQLEYNKPLLNIQQELKEKGILDKQPPALFQGTLKPFQSEGFVWMKSLHFRNIGGLLADDMGLGKTIQVIAFLAYLKSKESLRPSLIVVPKTLMDNWKKEMLKFAPDLTLSLYTHQGAERVKHPDLIKRYEIVLTTYETLVRDQLVMGQVDWQVVICDEAQKIKNPSTATARVIKALKSKCRLALTGTPVENSLSELWSIMDFVQPGLLGSLNDFRKEFIHPLEEGDQQVSEVEQRLIYKISPVYKRRTKKGELGDQLPRKHTVTEEVPLGIEQKQLYEEILSLVHNKAMLPIQAIGQLKKLCSHPGLINSTYSSLPVDDVPKLQKTLEILELIRRRGEKVLIFTEYRMMQAILKRHIMEKFNINPMIINGMTRGRQVVVDEFNAKPGFDVLILSPKAAGTGLTITAANHVIHYTRWWNPAVENQATDRAYRIGQEKDVTVYYPIVKDKEGFLSRGTVEEIVHRIINEKIELANSVIVPSNKLGIEEEVLEAMALH
ncbi:hypothetical protein GCM10010965_25590 [Caldalkalibacillus thermarum]|uniref:DEAD/DEAH box helicase n=1 Tax=Caldalkalibacillus thermarum TaxID=296745 RepID=UPI00166A5DCD|nr:DEAD/DEAH box helicase [Caldalkalibacillus thermarum]GGK31636.1 hypothetical protein GCM10010965_25590 [Caldalkalibacillus thermarum]